MTDEDLWTSSRLASVRRCARLHEYRYVRGIGEASSDTARFGTVGHDALEHGLLNYDDPEARMAASLAACDKLADRYERARARAALIGYWTRWGNEQWTILDVEKEFRFWLGDVYMGGKMDAVIRDERDGRVYVVEHKFTSMDSAPGSAYWERLTIDTQVSVYTDGAAQLGYDVAGVVYDVIAKPGHKPAMATPLEQRKYTQEKATAGKGCKACGGRAGGKLGPARGAGKRKLDDAIAADAIAIVMGDEPDCVPCGGSGWAEEPKHEPSRLYAGLREHDESPDDFEARVMEAIAAAPDTYYRRGVIVRLEDELPKMRSDIVDTVRMARVAQVFGVAPRNPDACAKFGSLCGFFDACSGRADIDDVIRFPRARAHAELAAPTTP